MKIRRFKSKNIFYYNYLVRRFCNNDKGFTPRSIRSVHFLNKKARPNSVINLSSATYKIYDPMYPLESSGYKILPTYVGNNLIKDILNPIFTSRYILGENYNSLNGSVFDVLEAYSYSNFNRNLQMYLPEYDYKKLHDIGVVISYGNTYKYFYPFRNLGIDSNLEETSDELSLGIYYRDNVFYLKESNGRFSSLDLTKSKYYWGVPSPLQDVDDDEVCNNNNPCIYLGLSETLSPLLSLYLPLASEFRCVDNSSIVYASNVYWCGVKICKEIYLSDIIQYNYTETLTQMELEAKSSSYAGALHSKYSSSLGVEGYWYITSSELQSCITDGYVTQDTVLVNREFLPCYITSSPNSINKSDYFTPSSDSSDLKKYYVMVLRAAGTIPSTYYFMEIDPLAITGVSVSQSPFVGRVRSEFPLEILPHLWKLSIQIKQQF